MSGMHPPPCYVAEVAAAPVAVALARAPARTPPGIRRSLVEARSRLAARGWTWPRCSPWRAARWLAAAIRAVSDVMAHGAPCSGSGSGHAWLHFDCPLSCGCLTSLDPSCFSSLHMLLCAEACPSSLHMPLGRRRRME